MAITIPKDAKRLTDGELIPEIRYREVRGR